VTGVKACDSRRVRTFNLNAQLVRLAERGGHSCEWPEGRLQSTQCPLVTDMESLISARNSDTEQMAQE